MRVVQSVHTPSLFAQRIRKRNIIGAERLIQRKSFQQRKACRSNLDVRYQYVKSRVTFDESQKITIFLSRILVNSKIKLIFNFIYVYCNCL